MIFVMSELAQKIATLRGELSGEAAAEKCGVSRETFYRIQRGGTVKLDTLKKIWSAFKLAPADQAELLSAWLIKEAGPEHSKVLIEPAIHGASALKDAGNNQTAQAMMLFRELAPEQRALIIKSMQRPEILASLNSMNTVWEKFDREKAKRK